MKNKSLMRAEKRYLDPKTSRWLSADPALKDYILGAPVNEEAKKRNNELPGMGCVFNTVNLHLYHYARNNPVRYIDPNGMWVDNGDGTYTAEQNDTIWGLSEQVTGDGNNWESFGYEGDPTKLQPWETVGKPYETTVTADATGKFIGKRPTPEDVINSFTGEAISLGASALWFGVSSFETKNWTVTKGTFGASVGAPGGVGFEKSETRRR